VKRQRFRAFGRKDVTVIGGDSHGTAAMIPKRSRNRTAPNASRGENYCEPTCPTTYASSDECWFDFDEKDQVIANVPGSVSLVLQ